MEDDGAMAEGEKKTEAPLGPRLIDITVHEWGNQASGHSKLEAANRYGDLCS